MASSLPPHTYIIAYSSSIKALKQHQMWTKCETKESKDNQSRSHGHEQYKEPKGIIVSKPMGLKNRNGLFYYVIFNITVITVILQIEEKKVITVIFNNCYSILGLTPVKWVLHSISRIDLRGPH